MIFRNVTTMARTPDVRKGDLNVDFTSGRPWLRDAICQQTDPEAFFPNKGGSSRAAKQICLGCDVREQCLRWALENDEHYGVWGGMTERERRRLKHQERTVENAEKTTDVVDETAA